jgi:tetratricopeptide (TPR) repeat protein
VPNADPQASFDVAVRHLFRHLDDAVALRTNPIVRRFFKAPDGDTVAGRRAALDTVRRLVREGAERSKPPGESDPRSKREYTIFERHCLQRMSLKRVADELGVSAAQCYRDRASICSRVARYVLDYAGLPDAIELPRFDEFRFRMGLAMRSLEVGDYSSATARFDVLLHTASSPLQQIEVLCNKAELFIIVGERGCVDALLTDARHILAEHAAALGPADTGIGKARILLVDWHRRFECHDRVAARAAIDAAVAILKPLYACATDEVKELYAKVLSSRGVALRASAELRAAGDTFAEALAVLGDVRAPSPLLSLETIAHSYRLRNGLITESTYYVSAQERLETLVDLATRARASGSLMLNLNVLLGILEFYAYAGNDARAHETARTALALAREAPNKNDVAHIATTVASLLTYTSYWHVVPSLLRSVSPEQFVSVAPDHYAHTKARYNLRLRAYDRALSLASTESPKAESSYYDTKMQIVAACAAEGLGRHRDAVNYVEEALSSAERFCVVPTLPDAYHVAARITGSARLRRRAEEVAEVLRA